jgi:uncharacterized membrane protein (DUF4010 family)
MFLRVLAVLAALNAALLPWVAPALSAATVAAIGFALAAAYWRGAGQRVPSDIKLRNPFSFWSVIGFAAFLGIIILAGRALGENFGAAATLLGAAIVGVADVDSVVVSVSKLAPGPLSLQSVALTILTAVASNTAGKIAIGASIGRGLYALEIAGMALACFVAGALALWLTFRFLPE